jgi:hypothetical protein
VDKQLGKRPGIAESGYRAVTNRAASGLAQRHLEDSASKSPASRGADILSGKHDKSGKH